MSSAAVSLPSGRRNAINPWFVAATVVIPTLIGSVDTTIVGVARPYIAGGLSAPADDDEGNCKAIGLSDVGLDQTQEIFDTGNIKPAVVHVESHPYLRQWDLLDYCRKNGIVFQAFAALVHCNEPKLLEDPVITAIAKRVKKTPAQVLLARAIQRGTALLTISKTPSRIKENFEVSALPEEAVREISEGVKLRVRFNPVVETGVPGFIPRGNVG